MKILTIEDTNIDILISKIDEYKRKKITDAETFENFQYIDPNSNINNIGSHNNNIVFGRRGSGKTSLVIAAINKIRTENKDVYIKFDFQTFRGKKFEKIILEILNKTLISIKKETKYFKKKFIKNLFFNKRISEIERKITHSLTLINHQKSSLNIKENSNLEDSLSNALNVDIDSESKNKNFNAKVEAKTSKKQSLTQVNAEEYLMQSNDDFLHSQNLENIQSKIIDIINTFHTLYGKRVILFFDDFYQIKKNIHPNILEYFHTISKECIKNSFSFKVCALPDSIKYNYDGENTFSLKDDYSTINVDHNLDRLNHQMEYLLDILCKLHNEININPQEIKNLFVGENLTHCVLGAGGLPRDFMILFSDSLKKARKNNHDKIAAEDVYSAILDLSIDKEEKSKLDSEIDSEQIKKAILLIQTEVVDNLKTNVILYPFKNYEKDIKLLRELENLRYIHSIRDTIKDKNKNTFHPYLIDMSFCVTQKTKKTGMYFNKFWVQDDARTLDNLRRAPIWNFDMNKLIN